MRFPRFPRIVSPTLALIVKLSQGFKASPKSPYSSKAARQLFSYQKAAQRKVMVAPPAVGKSTTRVVKVPPELGMGYGKP